MSSEGSGLFSGFSPGAESNVDCVEPIPILCRAAPAFSMRALRGMVRMMPFLRIAAPLLIAAGAVLILVGVLGLLT